ncbi:MAG: hypothetical protein EOP50_05995 [Sphingobacteriales bacterium]|nr:MAG: hypothetical protein EOP50_05995 [Sphingobacteriales bacterium]
MDDETGIVEKVQELVARMNVKHNLSVSVEIGAECNALNEHLQVVLYRIIQEQFNNIISYAAAKTVTIRLMKQAGDLLLKIQDDGKGMDLSSKTTGIGLVNIRRRVQILGGSVQIVSAPGKGFSLTAAIPF